jgi:phenol hydroxylase P1 protein
MDQLGIAQYLTRLGLVMGQPGDLEAGKRAWQEATAWQGLRRYVEDTFVLKDWFELFVAQNIVLDGLLFPLAYGEVDKALAAKAGPAVSMLTRFQTEWFVDSSKWVDSVMKIAAAESPENKAQLAGWIAHWRGRALEALAPIASLALGDGADAGLARVAALLDARITKAGLTPAAN